MRKLLSDWQRLRQFIGIAFLVVLVIAGNPTSALFYIGALIAVCGIAARLWASGHVHKNKALATSGPYAYVRHPLYVGNHLIAFGYCLASSLWWSVPAWVAIAFVFYPQAIRDEDQRLAQRFPDEWSAWSEKTWALIPRFSPYLPGERGAWSFSQSLRQNGEPLIAVLLVAGLVILHQKFV